MGLFQLPLSEHAHVELQCLSQCLDNIAGDRLLSDCWSWNASKKSQYTTKKYYDLVHRPIVANPILNWIWKSCCTMSIKMFAWLVIMDRVNTKDMIQRRHWRIEDGLNVCYADLALWRTEIICSSNVISIREFGITCRYIGLPALIW